MPTNFPQKQKHKRVIKQTTSFIIIEKQARKTYYKEVMNETKAHALRKKLKLVSEFSRSIPGFRTFIVLRLSIFG